MSNQVVAISANTLECGKTVSDSKKKFIWKFRIGRKDYTLDLTSSALSGKRIVALNSVQIYSEQNMLNFNFEFSHNIEGHSFRIFRESETVHNYDLRVDNRSFSYLVKKGVHVQQKKTTGKYDVSAGDPFADFEKMTVGKTNKDTQNEFGDFDDFQNFQQKVNKKQEANFDDFNADFSNHQSSYVQPTSQKAQINKNSIDLLSEEHIDINQIRKIDFFPKASEETRPSNIGNLIDFTVVETKKSAPLQFESLI